MDSHAVDLWRKVVHDFAPVELILSRLIHTNGLPGKAEAGSETIFLKADRGEGKKEVRKEKQS